jgi:DNA polymerase-3 subunit epsilon
MPTDLGLDKLILPPDCDFVALDFETANREWNSACAIGLAFVAGGRVVANPSWLIRPPQLYFDPGFIKIHGITAADVADKPDFTELWTAISRHIEGRIIIAHNAEFDISVLQHTLDHYRLPRPTLDFACSKIIAQRTWPTLKKYGLAALAENHGIVFRHHDAGEDANVCAQLALKACFAKGVSGIAPLHEALNLVWGRLHADGHTPVATKGLVTVPAFGPWNERIHRQAEQLKRQERARQIDDVTVDRAAGSGVINGYIVTLAECACADFKGRKLPCKHIYRLHAALHE